MLCLIVYHGRYRAYGQIKMALPSRLNCQLTIIVQHFRSVRIWSCSFMSWIWQIVLKTTKKSSEYTQKTRVPSMQKNRYRLHAAFVVGIRSTIDSVQVCHQWRVGLKQFLRKNCLYGNSFLWINLTWIFESLLVYKWNFLDP